MVGLPPVCFPSCFTDDVVSGPLPPCSPIVCSLNTDPKMQGRAAMNQNLCSHGPKSTFLLFHLRCLGIYSLTASEKHNFKTGQIDGAEKTSIILWRREKKEVAENLEGVIWRKWGATLCGRKERSPIVTEEKAGRSRTDAGGPGTFDEWRKGDSFLITLIFLVYHVTSSLADSPHPGPSTVKAAT